MLRTRYRLRRKLLLPFIAVLLLACSPDISTGEEQELVETVLLEEVGPPATEEPGKPDPGISQSTALPPDVLPAALLQPDDLVYEGAFRLPEAPDEFGWGYSGYAMTYYPEGDSDGPQDGYPGSLFILGHDHRQQVGEVSIPAPVISSSTSTTELSTAATIQELQDITNGMFGALEIPRAGLSYLAAQGDQTAGKLYFCWGQHFQFELAPSHGWSELDLAAPNPAGPWIVGEYTNYVTDDYLVEIPESWANAYAPGLRLATGRFRDGSWGGLGPALFAIAPWNEGNPPPAGSVLQQVLPLLLYGENVPGAPELNIAEDRRMINYSEPDEWSGGAWLTLGEKSAVVLVGTKALGRIWYGFSNGVEYPISGDPDEVYPEVPPWPHDARGWWSEDISAQMLFFDPAELGAVARGELETWEPQPCSTLTLDDYLFDTGFDYERGKRYLVGAMALVQDDPETITTLWRILAHELGRIQGGCGVEEAYGITWYPEGWTGGEYLYLAAVATTSLEVGASALVVKTIAPLRCAGFLHRGCRGELRHSLDYVYQTWLPRSGERLACPLQIEYFGKDWKRRTGSAIETEWELYIPIE